jgi:nicotinate-nucleotide pyrophosphorylase (carboxylating)
MPRDSGQTHRLVRRLRWDELDRDWLRRLVLLAREEDLSGGGLRDKPARLGDPSTEILGSIGRARAHCVARGDMVIAGLNLLEIIFEVYGASCRVQPRVAEGDFVSAGTILAELEGSAKELLTAERTLLNFFQRLSGVATQTRLYVQALGASPTRLLDTRKTTPGFRLLEKYAVGQGGGYNHRLGLYDRIMVKDNHLAASVATAAERLTDLVVRARLARPDLLVEVEVDHLSQITPVLQAGADIVLLDNFTMPQLREAVGLLRGQAWSEVSGGVNLQTLPLIGEIAPDFVSAGALTHAAPWADIGMDWL